MSERGQGLIEYLILVCLVAVSAILVVSVVGKNIREQYANISAALGGHKKVEVTRAEAESYEARGMDDFMSGAKKAGDGGGGGRGFFGF